MHFSNTNINSFTENIKPIPILIFHTHNYANVTDTDIFHDTR